MGESRSSSLLGSVINVSQDRDGVRIDAPHGWEIHDVHHQWTKNETYHWETGNTFHMTSGQVLHLSLNTVEFHSTANMATMHLDITPLNVHMRPIPIGFDVHIEASKLRKHVNVHGGHHHQIVSNFHQESQAVHIKSTTKAQSGWDKAADLLASSPDADHLGTMTLEADGEMKLSSKGNIKIASGEDSETRLSLAPSNEDIGPGLARLSSVMTFVSARDILSLMGGDGAIEVQDNKITLEAGPTRCVFDGAANQINANAGTLSLNGRVNLGNPPVSPPAGRRASQAKTGEVELQDESPSSLMAAISEIKFPRG